MSDSLQPYGLQQARLPYPSPSPGVCSKLISIESGMPSNHLILCHSLFLRSIFPRIRVFPMSWLCTSGGQSIGVSASVLPMNIQGWFLLELTGLSSLLSRRLSRVFSNTTVWKHQFFISQLSLWSTSHIPTWLLEKPQLWLLRTFAGQVMSDVSAF